MGTPVSVTRGTVGLSMTDTLMTSVQVCCSSHSCFKVKKEKYIYNTHFPVFKLILILTETVKYLCLWGPWWLSSLGILKPLGFSSDSGLRVMRSSPTSGSEPGYGACLGISFFLSLCPSSHGHTHSLRMKEWMNEGMNGLNLCIGKSLIVTVLLWVPWKTFGEFIHQQRPEMKGPHFLKTSLTPHQREPPPPDICCSALRAQNQQTEDRWQYPGWGPWEQLHPCITQLGVTQFSWIFSCLNSLA